MYFFLSKKIKRYAAVFSFWYAVLVVFCALFNLSTICFLSAIIASVIGFSVYMNIDFNRYKINELAYILTPCKRVGESIISTSSSFDGIKIEVVAGEKQREGVAFLRHLANTVSCSNKCASA